MKPFRWLASAMALGWVTAAAGFVAQPYPKWEDGTVRMHLKLGASTQYTGGGTPNATALDAITAWNPYMRRVQLQGVAASTGQGGDENGQNEIFFHGSIYGYAFDDGTLAVTTLNVDGNRRTETDIVVNSGVRWDVYSGPYRAAFGLFDLRRVLVHELGHVLGLTHPDEHGQYQSAIMNSHFGEIEVPTTDDQDGAASLYGHGVANPAVPPQVTSGPYAQTVTEGDRAEFQVWVSGSSPFTFQWLKNGQEIPAATQSTYTIPATTFADAGRFAVRVSNEGGTQLSSEALLTVNPYLPPTITSQPADRTVEYGGYLYIAVSVEGSSPLSFTWYKDGAPLNPPYNGSSYSIYGATEAHRGTYRVEARNNKGSVMSNPATVTVLPPVAPIITQEPADAMLTLGDSRYLSVTVAGSPPLSYQWYFNGAKISGASGSGYNAVGERSNSGTYQVVVTNAAGSAASRHIVVTVNPPPPPTVGQLSNVATTPGQPVSWSAPSSYYGGPTTYQWFKGGQAIAGATGSSYSIGSAAAADEGDYFVVVTNASGSTTSRTSRLTVMQPSAPPGGWLAAERGGDIVYFVFANPARIERYDLVTEAWLPTITLPHTPAAFAVGPDAFFLAHDKAVWRYELDGTNGRQLGSNFESTVSALATWKEYILVTRLNYADGKLHALRGSDGTVVSTGNFSYWWGAKMAVAPTLNRIYAYTAGISPSDVVYATIADDGTLAGTTDSPYHGDYPEGSRVFVSPDDAYVIHDGGIVYRTSDFLYAGSFSGRVDDLAFDAEGRAVVLRGRNLILFTPQFTESKRLNTGTDAVRVFIHGPNAFLFGHPPLGGMISQSKLSLALATGPAPGPAVDANGLTFSPDTTFVDNDDVLNVYSKVHRQIFRWSPSERRYLDPIPLQGWPDFVTYSSATDRIYTAYADARILQIRRDEGSTVEEPFSSVPQRVLGLSTAGEYVFASDPSGAWSSYFTFAPNGTLAGERDWSYIGAEFVWNAAYRRMYQFRDTTSPNDLLYTEINADGSFGQQRDSPFHGEFEARYPIRISPDGGTVLLGSGIFYDASTMQVTNALPTMISDAIWVGSKLVTARQGWDTVVLERWGGSNYARDRQQTLPGRLLRLHSLASGQLIVVTVSPDAKPDYFVLNADLFDPAVSHQPLQVSAEPLPQAVTASGTATLTVEATGAVGLPTYSWLRDGKILSGATETSLVLADLQPARSGIYEASVTGLNGSTSSSPVIVGVTTTEKIIGTGAEVGADIVHPNRNVYDQVLLQGEAASVTADPGQVLRMSFVDLSNDIVQVEFAGPGTLTVALEESSGPASPLHYRQPNVSYMKGHARIVIAGATADTHLSVFSVGRANAVNQALFIPGLEYDGVADIGSIAVLSADGKFGGLRAANANFVETAGLTGIYAPGVQFTGPVYLGDIHAYDDATGAIVLGGTGDARIAGGDLQQNNGRAVKVRGLTELRFVDGVTSHGEPMPAQQNRARLEEDGVDVTGRLVPTQ